MRLWAPPVVGAMLYPGLILSFQWAVRGYRETGGLLMPVLALLLMLMATSVPAMAAAALFRVRQYDGPAVTRGVLYLVFAIPSLFSLTYSLSRVAGVREYLAEIWIGLWIAAGLALYLQRGASEPVSSGSGVSRLRVIHGVTALVLLLAFLLAHLINHDLALWSVSLHRTVMSTLRLWYRSAWVEPVLVGLLVVMICTGVPMVVHHSRRRMDAFRVAQLATGAYVGVFLCSHVFAVLSQRRLGVETDWVFAAGPDSLLDGRGMSGRLIPHYLLGSLCLIVHVACGLRVVMLQHGVARIAGNKVFYGLACAAVVIAASSLAALLGFHVVGE